MMSPTPTSDLRPCLFCFCKCVFCCFLISFSIGMEAIHRFPPMIHCLLYVHKMFFHSNLSRASADVDKWAACLECSVTPRPLYYR